ncbi:zinc finger CCCH domain-containing protein 44 [Cajanus cajan]|uniref:zinc finger CCCH domain-containing protein 44 n=1 Tax=Cajanus cajan TaxID=3821 RepID=UPI00098DA300|nr:zinc finger CCCH domain-containing protein 44 [Cajanus cajan]
MANKREKPERIIWLDDQPGEEWCFECKDGGQLVLCDHENCGKVYHPKCVGRDGSYFDTVKSWVCGRHFCNYCHEPPEFNCLGCQNALCENCFAVSSEFTVVRGVQSLCIDCLEIVKIIEQNLNHDSEGNKISLDDRETYECLFKEYWEIVKEKEGLTGEDISAAQLNCQKATNFMHQKNLSRSEEGKQNDSTSWDSKDILTEIAKVKEGLTSEDISAAQPNYKRGKKFMHHKSSSEDEEEKLNDSMSSDSDEGYKPPKRKRYNLEKFVGWGSKPLISFLASIGKDETEPLTQWSVTSLIHEYIKEKNLHDPKYRGKFLPDEKLFPIFRKKVVSKSQIYSLLKCHFAKKLDDSSSEKNDKQIKNSSSDKHVNDRPKCMKSRLSSLIGKSVLRKGDFFIKSSHFASMSVNNINLIYLKRSLVLEFSKQPETFMNKVVGTFVRAKVDSSDSKQRKSHHLVRVVGVVFSEMSNGTLLQVSFMTKAIPISDLSDEDFTEQECEDLQQKVKANLLPKLTVVEVEEKARSLHVDITKHRIRTRLVHLQNQIERASLRGRNGEKIALLEEKEELEKPSKQEQLLRHMPSVRAELIDAKYDDSEDD